MNALNGRPKGREFITGSRFTGVVAYSYICAQFTEYGEFSIAEYPEFRRMATTYTSNFDKK